MTKSEISTATMEELDARYNYLSDLIYHDKHRASEWTLSETRRAIFESVLVEKEIQKRVEQEF